MQDTLHNADFPEKAHQTKVRAGGKCEACGHKHDPQSGHSLTVHHLDNDPKNDADWNLAALCQRCHLRYQGRDVFSQTLMEFMKPNYWLLPHILGYLAEKAKAMKR